MNEVKIKVKDKKEKGTPAERIIKELSEVRLIEEISKIREATSTQRKTYILDRPNIYQV
jgi:hypothetical protein